MNRAYRRFDTVTHAQAARVLRDSLVVTRLACARGMLGGELKSVKRFLCIRGADDDAGIRVVYNGGGNAQWLRD
jgi:hypothetical protein